MELRIAVNKRFSAFALDVDVTITQDRIGIFGPSGSGKSTLVSLISGLEQPDGGTIHLNGEALFDKHKSIPPDKRRIGVIFQHPHLFPHLSVTANLLYGYHRCAAEHRRIDFDSLIDILQLGHLLERGVNNLSGGEKQRVAIGRAVLSNPQLLLMDEPLSALDDNLKYQIIMYLKTTCARFNIPFIFISHSLIEMRLMTDTAAIISQGRISEICSTEALARQRMAYSPVGYINILGLNGMTERSGLCAYNWNGGELLLSLGNRDTPNGLFELSSKDIILFKNHPEAISARNLLKCTVAGLFESGTKLGVELDCGHGRLVSEIVPDAARELGVEAGRTVYAAFKASAFRRLAGTEPGQETGQ